METMEVSFLDHFQEIENAIGAKLTDNLTYKSLLDFLPYSFKQIHPSPCCSQSKVEHNQGTSTGILARQRSLLKSNFCWRLPFILVDIFPYLMLNLRSQVPPTQFFNCPLSSPSLLHGLQTLTLSFPVPPYFFLHRLSPHRVYYILNSSWQLRFRGPELTHPLFHHSEIITLTFSVWCSRAISYWLTRAKCMFFSQIRQLPRFPTGSFKSAA